MAKNIIDLNDKSEKTLNRIKGIGLIGGRVVRNRADQVNLALEILDGLIEKKVLSEFELGNVLKK